MTAAFDRRERLQSPKLMWPLFTSSAQNFTLGTDDAELLHRLSNMFGVMPFRCRYSTTVQILNSSKVVEILLSICQRVHKHFP